MWQYHPNTNKGIMSPLQTLFSRLMENFNQSSRMHVKVHSALNCKIYCCMIWTVGGIIKLLYIWFWLHNVNRVGTRSFVPVGCPRIDPPRRRLPVARWCSRPFDKSVTFLHLYYHRQRVALGTSLRVYLDSFCTKFALELSIVFFFQCSICSRNSVYSE